MLTLIPYICPRKETSLLCEILPIELAIVWLIERLGLQVSHTYSLCSHIFNDDMEHCFEKPMACIMIRIYKEDIKDFIIFSQCSKATFHFVQSFNKRLNYSKISKTLVELSVSLFIHILYRVTIYDEEEPENRKALCKDLREQVKLILKNWIVLREVIGGSFFGGNIRTLGYQRGLAKEDLELKFWENILALKFPCKEMKNELEKIVAELVNDRVTGIPSPELKIDLFVSVERREGIPDFFRNIFLTKAIDALDDLFSRKQSASQIQRWDQLVKLNSARVVELIAKILEKKYPDFMSVPEVPFHDLLEWELWPGFLKVYYAQVEKKEGEWALIVTCAISKLEAVCANIHNGDITVTELRAIKDKQTQMNKLCEASDSQPAVLQESIAKRLKEFKHFEDYKGKLLHFLSQIGRKLIG
ncbi:PREDICTED: uncharacterized protein LOC109582364 [Amphimedon queenslandica]|uniref:Uncharacterized protein n=1 Tax=Amphimedon queenslandica TaxID=400682 RepID=A0AAN0J7B7_AMPQE|nr:PREDICTED: uncharacterized protein LOC109582364 [Amphimedon queenslandica]|eukprot:XP_019852593.1 PREDICTED: uncharacterized protein LOC109582364 [Amphimedon queenslandica]